MLLEQLLDRLDGDAGPLHDGMAAERVSDRRLQDIAEAHRAVVAKHHHVSLEGAGNAGRQETCAGNDVEPEMVAVVRDGGSCGGRTLAADDLGLTFALIEDHHGDVAARAAQMRLDDLQCECGRDAGIEGVAAFLEDAHRNGRRDPVGRGDDAERAVDLGARGEGAGVDVGHLGGLRKE